MSYSYYHVEKRIIEALDMYNNNDYASVKAAVIDFDLPSH